MFVYLIYMFNLKIIFLEKLSRLSGNKRSGLIQDGDKPGAMMIPALQAGQ